MADPTAVAPNAESSPADSETEPQPPRSTRPWRIITTTLIVLTSVLAPLAVDSVWIRDQLLNTDAFVEGMSPLIRDPHVQDQIVDKINDDVLADVDLQAILEKELPENLTFLSGPAEDAIRGFVRTATQRIVESDQFATLFDKSLRLTHATLMKVLTGGGPIVQVENGVVTLDLTSLRTRVVEKVEGSGLGKFVNVDPNKVVRITLMESTELAKAQRFIRLLDNLGIWLPIVVVALGGIAIFLSRNRRRGVMWLGAGISIAMVVHLAALAVGRSLYIDVVTKSLSKNASGTAYDLLIHFPRTGTRTILLLGLIMTLGAIIAGPAPWAVRLRSLVTAAAGRGGEAAGAAVGPLASVGRFLAPRESGIRIAIFIIAALSLAAGERPTAGTVIWTTVFALLAVILLRVLAAAGPAPGAEPGTTAETPAPPTTPPTSPPTSPPTIDTPV